MKNIKEPSIKMLFSAQLQIKGLYLLGRAHFQKTHSMLSPHSHAGMEFMVILKGTQQYVVGEDVYTLRGGDVFVTYPGEIHSGGDAPQDVAEIIWFQLDLMDSLNFLGTVSPASEYLYDQLCNYHHRIRHISQTELQVLRKAFQMLNSDTVKFRLLGHNYLLAFIMNNLCDCEEKNKKERDSGFNLSIAQNYINEHLYDNPTQEELAAHCGFSPSKFNVYFKEHVGMTPHAYIVTLKLEKAKELLRDSEKSITEISHELCFSSGDYFSSVFKKYTGMTPSQYRLQYKYTSETVIVH